MKKIITKIMIPIVAFVALMCISTPIAAASEKNEVETVSVVTEAAQEFELGDVNGDGYIDVVDASWVLNAYAKFQTGEDPLTPLQKQAADVNKDGSIDSIDSSNILSYYVYLATTEDEIPVSIDNYINKDVPKISTSGEIINPNPVKESDEPKENEEAKENPVIIEETLYFKPSTHYVHRSTCHWVKEDCHEEIIEIKDTNGIECRICTECNPKIEIVNQYVQPTSNVTTSGVSEYDYTLLCKIVASEYGGMADTYERAKVVASVMNMVRDSRWPNSVEAVLDQSCAPWGFNKYAEYYCGSIHYSAMSDAVDYYFNNPGTFAGWTCNQWWGDGRYNHFYTI